MFYAGQSSFASVDSITCSQQLAIKSRLLATKSFKTAFKTALFLSEIKLRLLKNLNLMPLLHLELQKIQGVESP